VAALVVIERAASSTVPRITPAFAELLGLALEGPAQALDNALMLRRAEALSVTDDLTQLYNSRYLSQVLRRETKRASRSGRPLSLLFIDLDGFKAVNDTYGHLAGSRALVEAAAMIKVSARETDVVARFGGDEFAIVLPDTTSEGALAVGDRVRERVAAHPFLQGEGFQIALTVSVGVATLPDVSISADGLPALDPPKGRAWEPTNLDASAPAIGRPGAAPPAYDRVQTGRRFHSIFEPRPSA